MKILKYLVLGIAVIILLFGYIGLGIGLQKLAREITRQERTLDDFFCAECTSIPLYEENLKKAEAAYCNYRQLDEKYKASGTSGLAEIDAERALQRAQDRLKRSKEACARAKDCD
jgi:hypothetical protein